MSAFDAALLLIAWSYCVDMNPIATVRLPVDLCESARPAVEGTLWMLGQTVTTECVDAESSAFADHTRDAEYCFP
jgi:hypothetical protein